MAANNSKFLPELDDKAFARNQKMAWLLYLDKLTTWLWQDNDGAARWTLILDDVLRRASINHPPRTAAGLKNQVNHQSRLKLALVHAFGLWTLEELFRGNGVTLRTQKVIQGGDNGHVGRPCEVSLAPPCIRKRCSMLTCDFFQGFESCHFFCYKNWGKSRCSRQVPVQQHGRRTLCRHRAFSNMPPNPMYRCLVL